MITTDILREMTHHHIAAEGDLVPGRIGISYVWAGNGLFKYARNPTMEAVVQQATVATPGLPDLHPALAWEDWPDLLPGALLAQVLAEARAMLGPLGGADAASELLVPIEGQWLIVLDADGQPTVLRPPQAAGPGRVRYELPLGTTVLLDIHSHHALPAFFSATDDADDTWLSVSAVIGTIFDDQPTITCRLNVYGTHQLIPATMIVDDLGPVVDVLAMPTLVPLPLRHHEPNQETCDQETWGNVQDSLTLLAEALVDAGLDPLAHDEDAAQLFDLLDGAVRRARQEADHAVARA